MIISMKDKDLVSKKEQNFAGIDYQENWIFFNANSLLPNHN